MAEQSDMARLVGKNIRERRKEKGMTIAALAKQVKVSAAYISQVERGVLEPSVQMLRSFALHLETPEIMLVSSTLPQDPLYIKEADQRTREKAVRTSAAYEPLAPPALESGRPMQLAAHLVHLPPDEADYEDVTRAQGVSFVLVLKGAVDCVAGDERQVLNEGDTITVNREVPHKIRSAGGEEATVFLITDITEY